MLKSQIAWMRPVNDVFDPVSRPAHYNSHVSGVETILIAEQMGYLLGNAMKYIMRYRYKGVPLQDLQKCRWYVERAMTTRHNGTVKTPEFTHTGARAAEPLEQYLAHEESTFVKNVINNLWTAFLYPGSITYLQFAYGYLSSEIDSMEAVQKNLAPGKDT